MIRYCLEIFPAASTFLCPGCDRDCIDRHFLWRFRGPETDRTCGALFAYSSMSHFGFIALGIFVFTSAGQSGSVVYMVAHGLAPAGLFIAAGYLMSRRGGSAQLSSFGGVNKVAPVLAGFFLDRGAVQPGLARHGLLHR